MTRHVADPGFTLADRLAHPAPMTPLEVARVGEQVATELDGWHRGGVCHLAIEPDRIEVRADDQGRLHARLRPPVVEEPGAAGARYRAPEQLTGRPVGPAADVFSLGVLLLDGLVGRRVDPPGIPDDLGSAWRYLLTGMVATSPADRPTAATVAHTLAQVPGVGTPAPETAPETTPEPEVPRSKLLPGGAQVEPTPIDLPRESRLAKLRPSIAGRRKPPEPDVRQQL